LRCYTAGQPDWSAANNKNIIPAHASKLKQRRYNISWVTGRNLLPPLNVNNFNKSKWHIYFKMCK